MEIKNKNYISLFFWIISLIIIGFIIASLTKPEINNWYITLNLSLLTPPDYVFPIAWTVLYSMIGTCGWIIWSVSSFQGSNFIKSLYITQLFLNWSWTPLFFRYHFIDISLIVLFLMDMFVIIIIYLAYSKCKKVSLIMIPYLLWILFATYLNFYIVQYN